MYEGLIQFGNVTMVDNHMTYHYARTAGIPWLRACSVCNGLTERGRVFQTPHHDAEKPPWWNPSVRDSELFYGLYALSLKGADSSTREVDLIESLADGGYTGARRFAMREMVLRGLLVAASDCAIGYGLEWLRSFDTAAPCAEFTLTVSECCPCVCGPGCDDPACQQSCVLPYLRQFQRVRVVSGPEVLRRQEMSGGAYAEVELVFVAQNPHAYAPHGIPFAFDTGQAAVVHRDLPPVPAPVVDPFHPGLSHGETRIDLLQVGPFVDFVETRRVVAVEQGAQPSVSMDVALFAAHGATGPIVVRMLQGGVERAAFRVPLIPDGGLVVVDYANRSVQTGTPNDMEVNTAFVTAPSGLPIVWPSSFAVEDVTIVVEQPVGAVPVQVTGMIVGRASA